MNEKISRRRLLKKLAAAVGSLGLSKMLGILPREATAQDLDEYCYLPSILKDFRPPPSPTPTATSTSPPPPTTSRVVHVYSEDATSWNFSTGWYGHYVHQNEVNRMVDEGMKQLTGQPTVAAAWRTLLTGYASGQAIAIKVNFNNCSTSCSDGDNIIDALIEPVNALVRGMKAMGVREEDIWVYDAVRRLPDRFRSRCLYSGVHFFDRSGAGCAEPASFSSNDPNAEVNFAHPSLTPRRLTDVVINATYLINVPIMKDHGIAGVTLGFKNHFGSIDQISGPGNDHLHYYIDPGDSRYRPGYSPLVDIYVSPHIQDKTVLVVGDGLYGALVNTNVKPSRWSTFENDAPNSLFFAVDPVAIDCVMLDILDAEPVYHPRGSTDDYLKLAARAGLGIFERGQPWGSGYSQIDYQKIQL